MHAKNAILKCSTEIPCIDEVNETTSGMFKWNKKATHDTYTRYMYVCIGWDIDPD